jgi:hypothetical protein
MKDKLREILTRRVTWTFSLWQWGLISLAIALCVLMLPGCTVNRHQRGGEATTRVGPPEPAVIQHIQQPENPEGSSEIQWEEFRTIMHTDGTVERIGRKSMSRIGGSQDYAKILKEYGKTEYFRGLVFGLCLMGVAWMAYRKDWPLISGILAVGAVASIFVAWWAGALSILAGAGIYIGYKVALPLPPTT